MESHGFITFMARRSQGRLRHDQAIQHVELGRILGGGNIASGRRARAARTSTKVSTLLSLCASIQTPPACPPFDKERLLALSDQGISKEGVIIQGPVLTAPGGEPRRCDQASSRADQWWRLFVQNGRRPDQTTQGSQIRGMDSQDQARPVEIAAGQGELIG